MTTHPTWPHDRQLHAWWVTPDLLAGEYPGDKRSDAARAKIDLLSDAGVTAIVDLTTRDDPLLPYAEHLPDTIAHWSFPIPDLGVIDNAGYDAILAYIDDEIARDGRVYVHCWGGVGRTSTVVACWLGAQGLDLQSTLDRIDELRSGTRKSHRQFLQSGPQRRLVESRFID
ncbi:protein-tyrosine phosphatase family protein [Williamsia maris]|uniref:Dual specificity phosphatase, catalytic domain n=1 Tax=Williamsia maris TaxID=72806 RepID=A0ABT1HKE2_9NOCA|nr:serine/threonine protein phosphatase [Williamsia maris]MCP2178416.1 Dual specificity phosphatase, catalytic domain [Williamsia maris]